MKKLLLPVLISSALALTACCECKIPKTDKKDAHKQKNQSSQMLKDSKKQDKVATAVLASSPFAGLFALAGFADVEESSLVGKGILNYYDGDKIATTEGDLYRFYYTFNDTQSDDDKEAGFSQQAFDQSITQQMQQLGAKEFFNDIVPTEVDAKLTEMNGFQHNDYMADEIDFAKIKLRQFVLDKDGEQIIYQVVSDEHHGEVGAFTPVGFMSTSKATLANSAQPKPAQGQTNSDEPFAHVPLNKSIDPDDEQIVMSPTPALSTDAEVVKEGTLEVVEVPATKGESVDVKVAEEGESAEAEPVADEAKVDETSASTATEDPKVATPELVTAEKMQKQLESAEKITLHINFDSAKATIREDNRYIIDQLYDLLHKDRDLKFIIQGHTDSSGDAQMNQRLSLARAKEVKAELEKKGIDSSRLKAEGYGEDKPIASNDSRENRAKNRRVELVKF